MTKHITIAINITICIVGVTVVVEELAVVVVTVVVVVVGTLQSSATKRKITRSLLYLKRAE